MISMETFDRFLFAYTVGSHIIMVTMSISLILLITILEGLFLRKKESRYAELIHRLKRVFVISFGVGTASGIVMAVELVNLFPKFMTVVSTTGVINLFYAEVFAFFLETIALVIYVYFEGVYKWKYANFTLALTVLFGTLLSAVFITMVNSWMNTPNGFNLTEFIQNGTISGVIPWAPFITASTFAQVIHVITTTIFAGVMLNGAYFAYKYLKEKEPESRILYRTMVRITSVTSIISVILVGATGSHEMADILVNQPLKYAAFDLNLNSGTNMPERLFGTIQNGHYVGGLVIPKVQSLLASLETSKAVLPGLSQYPSSIWPPLLIHTTFDLMVVGGLIFGLFLFVEFLLFITKRDILKYRWILYSQIVLGLFSLVIYELGWVSDEVGRQPWIIYNTMKVSAAANYSTGLLLPGFFIVAFYLVLIPLTFYFFARIFNTSRGESISKVADKGGVDY